MVVIKKGNVSGSLVCTVPIPGPRQQKTGAEPPNFGDAPVGLGALVAASQFQWGSLSTVLQWIMLLSETSKK